MNSEITINIIDQLTTKKNILILLSVILLIVFWDSSWDYYDSTITKSISNIKPHWTLDCIHIFTVFFVTIVTFYNLINNKKISTETFLLSTLLTIIYIYWRFITDRYTFVSLTFKPYHKHTDIAFLFYASILTIKLKGWFNPHKEPFYYNNPFLIDKPISSPNNDLFGREKFAKEISFKIQSKLKADEAGALAIGINGVWGSGKTSFNNLIRQNISLNNRIVFEFNPWSSNSPSKIIENFFDGLVTEIAKYEPKLSKNISDYAKTLTSFDENALTKGINTASEFIFDVDSKSYDEINKAIGNIKKQVIIFIDDLDRLDRNEIIETLRLIRNTANFNNVTYIVSYDKDYVEEAIQSFNSYNYKYFLEKIFQFEFTLPKYEKAILRRELKNILNENFGGKNASLIENAIEARNLSGRSFTNEFVKTKRDVIRLANSLTFEYSLTEDEVHFADLYLLQLLKLKHQMIYEKLYDYHNVFFLTETRNSKLYLRLRKSSEKSLDDNFRDVLSLIDNSPLLDSPNTNVSSKEESNDNIIFHDFLEASTLNPFDIDIIKDLIDELIKEKSYNEAYNNIEQYKSFAYPGNFHKYFSFQLLATDLPARDFELARRKSYEDYKKVIFKWIDEGKLSEVIDRLEKINDFTSIEEFENHLKISIDIGRYRKENGESSYGLNYWQIVKTLKYPIVKNGSYKLFNTSENYKLYISNFFSEASFPFTFESNILVALMSHLKDFVLSNEELSEINLSYFKKYCENTKTITTDFRELYNNCVTLTENSRKEYEIIPEATNLFITHFKSFLKSSELSGFILHTSPVGNYFQIHDSWIKEIFSTIDIFEEYLRTASNLNKDEYYQEFLDFYNKSKENLFNGIEYEFKYLNPSRYR